MAEVALTTTVDLRQRNRGRILNVVRRHGLITRAGVARRTGLSKATVTTIVQELIEGGLLIEQAVPRPVRGQKSMCDQAARP